MLVHFSASLLLSTSIMNTADDRTMDINEARTMFAKMGCSLLSIRHRTDKWVKESDYTIKFISYDQKVRWTCRNDKSHVKETYLNPKNVMNNPFCRECTVESRNPAILLLDRIMPIIEFLGWTLITPVSDFARGMTDISNISIVCSRGHQFSTRICLLVKNGDLSACDRCVEDISTEIRESFRGSSSGTKSIRSVDELTKPRDSSMVETFPSRVTYDYRPELRISKSTIFEIPSIRAMIFDYFVIKTGRSRLSKFEFENLLKDEVYSILDDRSVWENDPIFGSFMIPGTVRNVIQQELMRHAAYMIFIKRVYLVSKGENRARTDV